MAIEKDWSVNKTNIEINSTILEATRKSQLKEWQIEQNMIELHKTRVYYTFIGSIVLLLVICLILGLRQEQQKPNSTTS